jgi:membrane protein
MMDALATRIEHWLFEPPDSLIGKPLWQLTRILRYPYALIRDMWRDELTLRAMSLVFTTLLSIVPLIALSFSLLKGLGYHHELEPVLYTFLEPLGDDKAGEFTAQVMKFVENVRGDVLGSIGLIFLLYTVISMVQKVEESFNFVWRVDQPRSFGRRFSEYLSVMVIGPAVLVGAIGLLSSMNSSSLMQGLSHYQPFGWLFAALGGLGPYLLVVSAFTFLYAFIPNTRVRFVPALIGGAAAGLAWLATGMILASFFKNSGGMMVIYAGFAIVIVALIWVHVSWVILLLGAQLAFYVQNPQYLRPGRGEIRVSSTVRERLALSVMYLIVNDYGAGTRWTTNRLAEHLEIPGAALAPIMTELEKHHLLVIAEDDTWLPARDPASIALCDVIDAVRHESAGPRLSRIRDIAPAVDAARQAEEAMRTRLRERSVKDLVDEK